MRRRVPIVSEPMEPSQQTASTGRNADETSGPASDAPPRRKPSPLDALIPFRRKKRATASVSRPTSKKKAKTR